MFIVSILEAMRTFKNQDSSVHSLSFVIEDSKICCYYGHYLYSNSASIEMVSNYTLFSFGNKLSSRWMYSWREKDLNEIWMKFIWLYKRHTVKVYAKRWWKLLITKHYISLDIQGWLHIVFIISCLEPSNSWK